MSDEDKKLAESIDELINKFDAWFQSAQKQEPLTRPEKAILRTYLIYAAKYQ